MNTPSIPTLESVATEFELWRKAKTSKFSRIPPHLINLVNQVRHNYKKSYIGKALRLGTFTLNKIFRSPSTSKPFLSHKNNSINFIELPNITSDATSPTGWLHCTLQRLDGSQLKIDTHSTQQLKDIIQLFLCCK